MPSNDELCSISKFLRSDASEVNRREAILQITQEYLSEDLSANWLSTKLSKDFQWLTGAAGFKFRQALNFNYIEDVVGFSLTQILESIAAVDNLQLGNDQEMHETRSLTHILFVHRSGDGDNGIKRGLLFPVLWKECSPANHQDDEIPASDKRLPTGLRKLAVTVRKTLTELDTDPRYRDKYRNYQLCFPPTAEPRWNESHEDQNDDSPRILDALFREDECESATATLVAALHIVVRGGKLDRFTLSTGAGEVDENGIIHRFKSVGDTLEAKLELVKKFQEQHNTRVRFLVPEADYDKAGRLLDSHTDKISLEAIPGSHDGNLLVAMQPLRELHQAEPMADDPIQCQQAYYNALRSQDRRSEFHFCVMQSDRACEQEHLLPTLRDQLKHWGLPADQNREYFCISLVSRAWEFPFLDYRLFKPGKHLFVLTNDFDINGSNGRQLKKTLYEKSDSVTQNNDRPEICEVDILTSVENLVKPDEIHNSIRKLIRENFHAYTNGFEASHQFVINGSSGATYLRNILIDFVPPGSFIVVYRGQTDPTTNQPLAGSHDLIVYRKEDGGRLVPLGSEPEAANDTSDAAKSTS